jgi:hypothetical protein
MKTENTRSDRHILLVLIILFAFCQNASAQAAPASTTTTTTAASGGAAAKDASGFIKATCQCTCDGKKIDAVGMYKPFQVIGVTLEPGAQSKAEGKCQEQCARTCGGRTTCNNQTDAECSTCCNGFCTTKYTGEAGTSVEAGKTPTDLCKTACTSTCKFKGTINGITDIIYMIAGMLGALMIAIHGIRMVTSQDPHDRDAAKSSIFHVIIALIIIAMAAALVNMFITMGGLQV